MGLGLTIRSKDGPIAVGGVDQQAAGSETTLLRAAACHLAVAVVLVLAGCTGSESADSSQSIPPSDPAAPTAATSATVVPDSAVQFDNDVWILDRPDEFVTAGNGGAYASGRFLVVVETGNSGLRVVEAAASQVGGEVVGGSSRLGIYQVELLGPDVGLSDPAISQVAEWPGVIAAGWSRAHLAPIQQEAPSDASDPMWSNTDVLWAFEMLGMDTLWGTDLSASDVGVLVADWGILEAHPDLDFAVPVRSIYDESADSRLPWDITQSSHGTAIAGLACGKHDGQGALGVADGCRLYGIDLLYDLTDVDNEPLNTAISLAVLIDETLRDHPDIRIVNASWGFGPNPANGCDKPADPIDVWVLYRLMSAHPDVLFVAAAGNCGIEVPAVETPYDLAELAIQMPAGAAALLDNVIAVTAVNEDMTAPSFANFGDAITVAAPGGLSAEGVGLWAPAFSCAAARCEPSYAQGQGTSFAAPFVTGLAALMFQANPDMTAAQAKGCVAESRNAGARDNESAPVIGLAAPLSSLQCAIDLNPDINIALPTPVPERIELPAGAIVDVSMPDMFGVLGNGGALVTMLGIEEGVCHWRVVAGVEMDERAVAYSYTQTYLGVTETLVFTADGAILSGNRSQARVTRQEGEVWPSARRAADFIGFASWTDTRVVGSRGARGGDDVCGASGLREIEADGIEVTDVTVWYSQFKLNDGDSAQSAVVSEAASRDLKQWVIDFWADPPVEVTVTNLVDRGQILGSEMVGPAVAGSRLMIWRIEGRDPAFIAVVDANYQFRMCAGGCPPPGPIQYSLTTGEITEWMLDNGLAEGEIGASTIIYDSHGGGDCLGCRPATSADIDTFWEFVESFGGLIDE